MAILMHCTSSNFRNFKVFFFAKSRIFDSGDRKLRVVVCCHDAEDKMAGDEAAVRSVCSVESTGDSEELEKILGVVVKRRKTFPAKCMELNKRGAHFELLRLENARVVTEENNDQEEFRKIIQKFRNQKSLHFTLDDLNEVKQKFEKHHSRIEEINKYLEKRKVLCN